mgnify:CR=1 FL=1
MPDPDDRHILAAAIQGHCDVIVTFNQKDFPDWALQPLKIETQDPDTFLLHQFHLAPGQFLTAIRKHRARLKNPQKNPNEYLETLLLQRLTQIVQVLKAYADQI